MLQSKLYPAISQTIQRHIVSLLILVAVINPLNILISDNAFVIALGRNQIYIDL